MSEDGDHRCQLAAVILNSDPNAPRQVNRVTRLDNFFPFSEGHCDRSLMDIQDFLIPVVTMGWDRRPRRQVFGHHHKVR